MTATSFYTISKSGLGIYKDRGSKFIGIAFPVENETDIKNTLQQLKKEHPSARHFCYAWRLGATMQNFRLNDDGEPSNTAGKPIFAQIQSSNLTNIFLVVIRYFGGTLLGTAGLIKAYKEAAQLAIENTEKIEKFISIKYHIKYGPDNMNKVMKLLKQLEAEILRQEYDECYHILFQIKKLNENVLLEKFKHLYNCELTLTDAF